MRKLKLLQAKNKKGVMDQLISVGIMILVISVLFGLTFLFTAELKEQIEETASDTTASTAYQAVNDTEQAGATVVDYLPLVFISLIFGAILSIVLRIILPYVNLGRTMGGGF